MKNILNKKVFLKAFFASTLVFSFAPASLALADTPSVSISANGTDGTASVSSNTDVILTWSSIGASACNASGSWAGQKPTNGSENIGKISISKTYTITCSNGATSASDSVTVNVTNQANGFWLETRVRNITKGETAWNQYINASPSDKIAFQITIVSQSINTLVNVIAKATLSSKITWSGNTTINSDSTSASIISGMDVGDIYTNQTKIITFEALVAPESNFSYGTTDLINTAMAYDTNQALTSTARVSVYDPSLSDATNVSTGALDTMARAFITTIGITYAILLGYFLYQKAYSGTETALIVSRKVKEKKIEAEKFLDFPSRFKTLKNSEKELNEKVAELRKKER